MFKVNFTNADVAYRKPKLIGNVDDNPPLGGAVQLGQYQAGVAQANAQNQAIANRANQRNRQYELDTARGVSEYNVAKLDAKLQQDEVAMSLSRFVGEEQLAKEIHIPTELDDPVVVAIQHGLLLIFTDLPFIQIRLFV